MVDYGYLYRSMIPSNEKVVKMTGRELSNLILINCTVWFWEKKYRLSTVIRTKEHGKSLLEGICLHVVNFHR